MKKLFALIACSTFMMLGCNEPQAKPAAKTEAAPAAQPAPAPAEQAPAVEAPKAQITNIDWAKALEMQKAGAMLIDVRTPAEVAEGTAEGSVNIPMQEAEQRLAEFPKDKDLLIFCRSGKRSMAVSERLRTRVQRGRRLHGLPEELASSWKTSRTTCGSPWTRRDLPWVSPARTLPLALSS